MRRQILVPIDRASSLRDVDRAIELARDGNGNGDGDAHVVVLGLEGKVATGVVPISAPDEATLRRRAEVTALGREARSRAVQADADLEFVAVAGPPTRAILEQARRLRADLVVVDDTMPWLPRGARRLGANRLRRGAPCPVEIVR